MLDQRFQIINLWRPLVGPVRDAPIAFADFNTVDMDLDLVNSNLGYPDPEETITVRHNPAQMWYYIRDQMPGEVWMFKCYDSDVSKARLAPHSAFLDPRWDGSGFTRQSIEVRALVCYD